MYRTGGYRHLIETVNVVRETDHFVTLESGEKCAKKGTYNKVHESYEDAKQYLLDKQRSAVADYARRLNDCQTLLEQIKAL